MTPETLLSPAVRARAAAPLPLSSLLALTMASFVVILTEVLPAGLLPQLAASLHSSQSVMGQLIGMYALGSLLAAIPLAVATQGVGRRTLLLAALAGFVVANTVTAFATSLPLIFGARFIGGVAAGLAWSMLVGYAARMVPPHQKGRAIAIAMAGTPLALTVGIPAGTYAGNLLGWRIAFGILSALAALLMVWIAVKLPAMRAVPGQQRQRVSSVLLLPGVRTVLGVLLLYVLAHNILYTYIAPLAALAQLAQRVDFLLALFGGCALASLLLVGVLVDRWLARLVTASIVLFLAACALLALWPAARAAVYVAVALWGLAFGGVATLFVTALSNAAGEAQDVAQSMMTTVWNLAIFAGSVAGGMLLGQFGASAFAYAASAALGLTLLIVVQTRRRSWWRGAAAR
ncbi:MFS transporter [Massilia sp. S19_KUP03_FR1]|uniref:MFS transporter n=1 Tax=Massilia sp. S19_KUP03_FR1 TaxID=3025503 RepID=UPI002FCD9A94